MAREYNRDNELRKLARSIRQEILKVEASMPNRMPLVLTPTGDTEEWQRLEDIYDDAVDEALNYCNRDEVAPGMATSIRDLAKVRFNQEGVEGEASRSEGGVSQSYETGIPRKIRSTLNRYRLAKVGRF